MSFKKTILKECIQADKQTNERCSYDMVKQIADHILTSSKHKPILGIICGSGLGGIADKLVNSEVHPYESIPNFPVTSVPGHMGRLVLGILSGIPVLCMQGRIHFYEGHPLWKCALSVRVMKLMGIDNLIVTNSAGALNPNYKLGDIMIIKDHLNMHNLGGDSPLCGMNDTRFGPLYPSMRNAYNKQLRQRAKKIILDTGLRDIVHEGVYTMTSGPMRETPAEIRALRMLGADAVGMSTVPEVIAARHSGMRVFAFSLITNVCMTEDESDGETSDVCQSISATGSSRLKETHSLVTQIAIEMINSHIPNVNH